VTHYATRFGSLDIADNQIWECIAAMPGFTELRHFALLHVPTHGPFVWLQSLDDALITFLLVAPAHFQLQYTQAPHFAHPQKSGIPMVMVILPQQPDGVLQTNGLAPLYFLPEKKQFGQWIVEQQESLTSDISTSNTPPANLHVLTILDDAQAPKKTVARPLSIGAA